MQPQLLRTQIYIWTLLVEGTMTACLGDALSPDLLGQRYEGPTQNLFILEAEWKSNAETQG